MKKRIIHNKSNTANSHIINKIDISKDTILDDIKKINLLSKNLTNSPHKSIKYPKISSKILIKDLSKNPIKDSTKNPIKDSTKTPIKDSSKNRKISNNRQTSPLQSLISDLLFL